MPVNVTPEDLEAFSPGISGPRSAALIEGVLARAAVFAPCLAEETFSQDAAAKSVLLQVIVRWNASGSGAITAETQGPYSVQRAPVRELFWPSEIAELQALCRVHNGTSTAKALYAMPPADREVDPALRPRRWPW